MTEFKKEDRYIVLKRKDLVGVPIHLKKELRNLMERMSEFIPEREYVVVESDWPEYEKVWDMIEARMNGTPQPAAVVPVELLERLAAPHQGDRGWQTWHTQQMIEASKELRAILEALK